MFFKKTSKKKPDFSLNDLAQIPFLNDLPDDQLEILSEVMNKKYFAEKDFVFKEGDCFSSVYFLIKGAVKIFKKVPEQTNHKVLAELRAPQLLGEQALISHGKRSASAYALEPLVVAELTYLDFELLIEKHPRLAVNIVRKIANIISVRLKTLNSKYVKEGNQMNSL